jgi:hypothetical protein
MKVGDIVEHIPLAGRRIHPNSYASVYMGLGLVIEIYTEQTGTKFYNVQWVEHSEKTTWIRPDYAKVIQ